jgi:Fe-S-cluster-containing dehydrogenase component
MMEFLVERRFVNGTRAMVIDLDRCTRCDDCVRACAATHEGNPRFLRQGVEIGRLLFTHACMHCADPVCMIGCPTGAIFREPESGRVLINDRTCIGCGTCANNCPYHNIRMVDVRDPSGALMVDEETKAPILRATKCDLCVEQPVSPACANACPHDALLRVDLSDPASVEALLRW